MPLYASERSSGQPCMSGCPQCGGVTPDLTAMKTPWVAHMHQLNASADINVLHCSLP